MTIPPWKEILWLDAERDESFRQEILRQSHAGLQLIGALLLVTALGAAAGGVIGPGRSDPEWIRPAGLVVLLLAGLLILAGSGWSWIYPHARQVALAAILAVSQGMMALTLAGHDEPPRAVTLTGWLLLGIAAPTITLPLRPLPGLLFSGLMMGSYLLLSRVARPAAELLAAEAAIVEAAVAAAILSAVVSGWLYRQRRAAHAAYQTTLRAAMELREVQARLVRAENASANVRLAAAVSHELNTPVGSLASAVDTLLVLAARQATAPPEQQARLVRLQADLRRSIQESTQRLQTIAARLARFTNLDRAEVQSATIHEIVRDVGDLVRPRLSAGTQLRYELEDVGQIVGNPQQLSAVLFNLVSNSAGALNGSGSVVLRTFRHNGRIEVSIEDDGRGIERERLNRIFDPDFSESAGRVTTANWSMFHARQIIREHGGDIRIASEPGVGTRVTIWLPPGPPDLIRGQ